MTALLKKAGEDFLLDIVGSSREQHDKNWARRVSDLMLQDRVFLHGAVYGDEKWEYFAGADIFCHPTTCDYSPLVIIEAMCAGLPVVSTRVGGIVDLVSDGISGFIVDLADTQSLADALATLLRDEDLRQRLGRKGRALYEASHRSESFEKAFVTLYQELGLI